MKPEPTIRELYAKILAKHNGRPPWYFRATWRLAQWLELERRVGGRVPRPGDFK